MHKVNPLPVIATFIEGGVCRKSKSVDGRGHSDLSLESFSTSDLFCSSSKLGACCAGVTLDGHIPSLAQLGKVTLSQWLEAPCNQH